MAITTNAKVVVRELKFLRELVGEDLDNAVITITHDALTSLVQKTPKDTGFAANSWYITHEADLNPGTESDPEAAKRKQIDSYTVKPNSEGLVLINWVPYIGVLEYGAENRVANRMVGQTVQKIEAIYG